MRIYSLIIGFNALNGLLSFLHYLLDCMNGDRVLFQRPERASFISTSAALIEGDAEKMFQRPERASFISTHLQGDRPSVIVRNVSTP